MEVVVGVAAIVVTVLLAIVGSIFTLAFRRWDAFERFRDGIAPWAFGALAFGVGLICGSYPGVSHETMGASALVVGALGITVLGATTVADGLAYRDPRRRDHDDQHGGRR